MDDPKVIKSIIKAMIISNPLKMTVRQLQQEFRNCEGHEVPYRQLGFPDLLQYLHSIPDTVQVIGSGPHAEVRAVVDKKAAHVAMLVSRQRTAVKKRRPSAPCFNRRVERARFIYNAAPLANNIDQSEKKTDVPSSNVIQHSLKKKEGPAAVLMNKITNKGKCEEISEKKKYDGGVGGSASAREMCPMGSVREDVNYKVPRAVQENLERLIKQFPEGIWFAKLPYEYRSRFQTNFNYVDYGYKSLIQLCCELPTIFKLEQFSKWDYRLYHVDAVINKRYFPETVRRPPSPAADEGLRPSKPALPDNVAEILKSMLPVAPPHTVGVDAFIPRQEIVSKTGDYIDVQVAEVYDPSKFWFSLHKCIRKLDALMDEMQSYYQQNSKSYEIPSCALEEGLYCVAFYMREYHRAIVTNMMPNSKTWVKVFFLDYGTVSTVSMDGLLYLHKDFSQLPAQAIRGRLAKIRPPQQHEFWSPEASQYFLDLILNKVFVAQIHARDDEAETFNLIMVDTNGEKDIFVNDSLVDAGHAHFDYQGWKGVCSYGKSVPSVEDIHLYPTFDEIEKALVPSFSDLSIITKTGSIPWDRILPQYFKTVETGNLNGENTCFASEKGKLARHREPVTSPKFSFIVNRTGSQTRSLSSGSTLGLSPQTPPSPNFPHQQSPSVQQKLFHLNVLDQCFENQTVRRKCVIKTQMFGLNLHLIFYKEKAHVLLNEVHAHYPGTSLKMLKRALCLEYLINIADINFRKHTDLLNELLKQNAIDGKYSNVDVIPLEHLAVVTKLLGNETILAESFEAVLRLYDRNSLVWY